MIRTFALSLSLALSGLVQAISCLPAVAQDAPADSDVRRLVASRAASKPAIDGLLDDAAWQAAAPATGFSIYSNADVLHPEQTIGRVCHDEDYLYIALRCEVREMVKFKARMQKAGGAFRYSHGGVIEVFLDTDRDRKTFQQYLLHANGSSMVTLSPGDDLKILGQEHLRSAARVTESGFNIEMAFPLAMLHLRRDTAAAWGFNLNRAHDLYDERHDRNGFFSSWNSTRGLGFQSPQRFGELQIDEDLSRYYWQVNLVTEPRVGDRDVRVLVGNETGKAFSGSMTLRIRSTENEAVYKKEVQLDAGGTVELVFSHTIGGRDIDACYELALRNDGGSVVYLGGTQKQDLTPGDDLTPPAPTEGQQQQGYMVWQRPFTESMSYRSVPRAEEIIEGLSVRSAAGEIVAAAFSLYPLQDIDDLHLAVSDLHGPAGAAIAASAVDVRQVTYQSDWRDPRVFEAKEHLLRRFESVDLTRDATQRFWVTFDLDGALPAGDYEGAISVTSSQGVMQLPLRATVLPFKLASGDDMGYFMYYPGVKEPSFRNRGFFRKIVRDMRRHGMNTFTLYHDWPGRIDVDDHRGAYGLTYAEIIETLQEEGLCREVPVIDMMTAWYYDPAMVMELQRIYKERGWPPVVYYVGDEIDYPERIINARRKLEALRAVSSDIQFTTALGEKGANALGHMYDIWIGCSTEALARRARSMGRQPWTYSCRSVAEIGPAYMRYFFGVYPWKIGLTGAALWSYTDDETFSDRFGRKYAYGEFAFTQGFEQEYGHVVLEGDDVIPTVTWEAVREGINDYRYMQTLKQMAEEALSQGTEAEKAAGRSGLQLLEKITEQTLLTPILSEALELRHQLREAQHMGDLDGHRRRAIDAILVIQNAKRGQ